MKNQMSVGVAGAFSAGRSILRFLILLLTASSPAWGAANVQPLFAQHIEFPVTGDQRFDSLLWGGMADHWDIYQSILGGSADQIAAVEGDKYHIEIGISFRAPAAQLPNAMVTYQVVGTDTDGNIVFSNLAATQQLLADPGFNAGPDNNPAWWQSRTHDGGDENPTNFIQGASNAFSGTNSVVLGGDISITDVISTRDPMVISNSYLHRGQVSLRGWVGVTTEEDPADPNVYDTLVFEIIDINSGETLVTGTLANNQFGLYGAHIEEFWDYSIFEGRTIQLVFRAKNDEILPTTFRLTQIELDLDLTP